MNEFSNTWQDIFEEGEELLWQGRPDTSIVWEKRHILPVFMGICIATLGLVWIFLVAEGSIATIVLGLIIVALGAFLGIGPPVFASMVRKASWYSLSNKRCFIAMHRKNIGRKLADYKIDPEFELKFNGKDPGTIIFATETRYQGGAPYEVKIGFERISDAAKVYQMMRSVQEAKDECALNDKQS